MESQTTTFFFGNIAGKGNKRIMYYLIYLGSAFFTSVLVEWLSHTRFFVDDPAAKSSKKNNVVAGLIQTGLYGIRTTLAYLVMLHVMSFDVWILLMAVAGYSIGFLIFGSRVFDDYDKHEHGFLYQKPATDLPPLTC